MTPEQVNGAFIGGGVVLLAVLVTWFVLTVIVFTKGWKHAVLLFRRTWTTSLKQDAQGAMTVQYSARERIKEGLHVSVDHEYLGRITDFSNLADPSAEGGGRKGDPEVSGRERS